MLDLRPASQRGHTQIGWLDSWHTFSFGGYRDHEQMGFSDLLVINDDRVQPAQGFGTHPHRDMEIFTYVLSGALEHRDSMGTGSVIRPGDVQMMSAGSGITHSEFNHAKDALVHFLQIWIVPNQQGVKPRYQQQFFADEQKRGQLRLIISPDGAEGSLSVYQDARVYAALLHGSEQVEHTLAPQRHAYVHVARGSLSINGQRLNAGDGARLRAQPGDAAGLTLSLSQGEQAEVLLFDLRPHELPRF